jgi:hypothetical protein
LGCQVNVLYLGAFAEFRLGSAGDEAGLFVAYKMKIIQLLGKVIVKQTVMTLFKCFVSV